MSRLELRDHAETLKSLIDGRPDDDLGKILQPILDTLKKMTRDWCPNYEADEDCNCRYCQARTLANLSERLRTIPAGYATDDGDINDLRAIATDLNEQAVKDDIDEVPFP